MSSQQQPRQWFRFGSFFQAAQQPQPRPSPPTTMPTQQPAIRAPLIQPRQNAALPTPSQDTPRPAGVPNEVNVQRFPVTPTPVSGPAPRLPTLPNAATPTTIKQPTKTIQPAVPQPRPLSFQLTPRVETQPLPSTQPLGASNEATIKSSVIAPMQPSAPPRSLPAPRSPPKAKTSSRSSPPPLPLTTTATTVPSLQLQPSDKTNASTPYSSPISRTPPSPGTVSIRSSSPTTSPGRKLSEPTSLLTSPVNEPQSYSPPPSNAFPSKSTNRDLKPKTSPEFNKPISESIKFRQTSRPPSSDQAEQKNVLVQETLDKSRVIPSKHNVHDQNSTETTKNKNGAKDKGKTTPKKPHDPEKSGTRLILAGVNKGAVMDLSNKDKKESSSFRGIGKKLGSVLDDGKQETTNPNMEAKNHNKRMSIQSSTMKAFINSNVQGVNNSISFNSSCTDKDPGVHLRLYNKGNVGQKEILQKDQSK
ncbi:hypothetical protein LIER_33439 [Lithospermum erythrorhizon]|uniref:Uncharacterized protein n=1 Tax=Lithospermum erythrorhizon TaxID=34254 RepID=A0AAV3S1Z8_LITER